MPGDLVQQMLQIAQAVAAANYRYTIHGAQQRIARGIQSHEVTEAIGTGRIIEDYPGHRFGPACLVSGKTVDGRTLHVLCSCKAVVDIITVYEPDPREWHTDFAIRR